MHLDVDVRAKSSISSNSINRGHIGFFDGLRGGLALWIFTYHAAMMVGFSTKLIPAGASAVDIFMLISGFLMAYTLSFRRSQDYSLTINKVMEFYLKRIVRIAPVYYLVLFFAVIFYANFSEFAHQATIAFPPVWAADLGNDPSIRSITLTNIILHMTFLFGLNPHYASNMPLPDWSLTLEMQFYAIVPFLLMAMKKYGLTLPIAGLAILNFLALRYIGLYLSPKIGGLWPQPSMLLFKIDCFIAGMLLALYLVDERFNKIEIFCLLLILICLEQDIIFAAAVALCFALLANVQAHTDFFARLLRFCKTILQSKPMQFFGDISYDLYLLHLPALYLATHILLENKWYAASPAPIRFGVLLGLSAIAVVPASYLIHIFVERPCQKAARPICAWILALKSRSQRKAISPSHIAL